MPNNKNKGKAKATQTSNKIKNQKQAISNLQNKLHEDNLKLRRPDNAQIIRDTQNYVMSCIDPENYPPRRYPDHYSEKTSIYKAINNFSIPVMQTAGDSVEVGSYYAEIHPELDGTIRVMDDIAEYGDGTLELIGKSYMGTNTNFFGIRYEEDVNLTNRYQLLAIEAGKIMDIVMPIYTEDWSTIGGEGVESLQTPTYIPGEGYFYPAVSGGRFALRGYMFETLNPGGSGHTGTIIAEQVARDGTVLAVHSSAYDGTNSNLAGLTFNLVACGPGIASFKIRVTNEINDGGGVISLVAGIDCYFNSNAYRSIPVPDKETLTADISKYRVVAQSALTSYMSNLLTVGGQASAVLYRGGLPNTYDDLYTYSDIAQHKDGYNGPLVDGSYGYWEAQDPIDMSFRTIQALNEYKRPYLLSAGIFNDISASTNALRLRVVTVIEFSSKSQLYEVLPSPVDPMLIVWTARVLAGVPNVMENGEHWDKIKDIAKKVYSVVKPVAGFLWQNREPFLQAAGLLASVGMSFI